MQLIATLNALATDVLAVGDPGSIIPPGGDKFTMMAGWVKWAAGLACFVGLCIVVATMAIQHRRGSGGEHGAAVGWVAGASILLGVGAGMLTALGA